MTTNMRSVPARLAVVTGLMLAALPAIAGAQKPTRRRQAPIEIKGQVPTPQVVTVRPREVPTYSRQVLVPRFYDHDFWPDIQTGYQMVPQRQISGRAALDSLGGADGTAADTSSASSVSPTAPQRLTPTAPGGAPASAPSTRGSTPATPPAATPARGSAPAATPDTTRRTPGTASAPPAR